VVRQLVSCRGEGALAYLTNQQIHVCLHFDSLLVSELSKIVCELLAGAFFLGQILLHFGH